MKEIDTEILDSLKKEKNSINYKLRDRIFKQAIREIDTSVGQILKTLKETGTEKNTFVIFTSDNGPAVGSSGPLKGRKGATFEGGMREPTVVYWPGKIPAGKTNDEVMTTMDLLPTFAKLSGASIPKDRVIDGMDIWSTLIGKSESPHDSFFYHKGKDLNAIRSGSWKLHVNVNNPIALYDLENDIAESKNILEYNQEIVLSLLKKIELFKDEIGKNSRPAAFVENPVPLKLTTK